jgi:aromatic ring-opening dioxygenase catalytic subunit (LigB family)
LSLQHQLDPELHLAAGRALGALRAQGVLIIGSGMSYHSMRGFRTPAGAQHSEIFDRWLTEAIARPDPERRWNDLARWTDAPSARQCHPREEHLLPLMVAAGAAAEERGHRVFSDVVMGTRISGFRFG